MHVSTTVSDWIGHREAMDARLVERFRRENGKALAVKDREEGYT